MASRLEKMNQIFERLAKSLATVNPDVAGHVLCPLCMRPFGRAALDRGATDGLTLEHIIPGALRGTGVTLTCRRCNNHQGSALDAHFVRMVRAQNWLDGDGSTMRGTVRIENLDLPMKLSWGKGDSPNTIAISGGGAEV
jgi:hypothetical protein